MVQEKYWCQQTLVTHRIKLTIVIVGFASILCIRETFCSQEQGVDDVLADLLTMQTMSANFSQVVLNSIDMQEVSSSTGSVLFSKPDLIKWSYDEPISQVFIKNGSSLSVYDKDLKQLSRLNHHFNQDIPIDFLTKDYQTLKKFYDIEKLKSSNDLSLVKISPLIDNTDYEKIKIEIKDAVLHKIKIFYRIGRIIEIKFDMVQVNLKLSESNFEFDLPFNTDIEEIN